MSDSSKHKRSFWKRNSSSIFICIVLVVVAISLGFTIWDILNATANSEYHTITITALHEFSLIFLTGALVVATATLAWVAWTRISDLNRTSEADFLLRIDHR